MAIPGSIVASGKLVTPGGAQGPLGAAGPNAVSADAGNLATLGSDNLISVPSSGIWSVRLRSFNSVGNPNFEVDQRAVNGSLSYPAGNSAQFQADRWLIAKQATTAVVTGNTGRLAAPNITPVPNTNFNITSSYLQVLVSTAQATLAAGDYLYYFQRVEGSSLRELMGDVTSLSILFGCSINLNFSIFIQDNASAHSIVIPCTAAAGTFNYLTFPNLPLWPSSGTFSQYPGAVGYFIGVCLGAGTTYQTGTAGAWVNGNFMATAANSNFLANAGATFQLRFLQHEPGPVCSTLIDKPFTQNLDECLRYYQKTYDYAVKPGTVSSNGQINLTTEASRAPTAYLPFQKRFAKVVPSLFIYSPVTGAVNVVRDSTGSVDRGVTAAPGLGEMAYNGLTLAAYNTSATQYMWHHTADTGW